MAAQMLEVEFAGVSRRVLPAGCEWKCCSWTKHMAMGIYRSDRKLHSRLLTILDPVEPAWSFCSVFGQSWSSRALNLSGP